jgi:acyl-lipid omega-6 desaturase (Delta-12 desaturase)
MQPARLERMTLAPHARRAMALGLLIFAADVVGYVAFASAAVAFDDLWVKLSFGLLAGACVALLAIVGHDSAHQSFLPNKRLNEIVGTLAFLPALHPFSLWEYHHNKVHHRYTAQIGIDNAFSPMTVEQYRAASPLRRGYYRFMRSLGGQPFFYLADIWWPDMFMPFGRKAPRLSAGNVADLLIVYAFIPVAVLCFAAVSLEASGGRETLGSALLDAAVFGVAVPFLVWNAFISFVTIVQHTGPDVRWTMPTGQPSSIEQSMAGTVHIKFPDFVDWAMHRVMQHQAHHVHMGVPLYHLKGAQDEVGRISNGRNAVVWTPAYHWRLTRTCKLYDPARQRWVGFDAARQAPPAVQDLAA